MRAGGKGGQNVNKVETGERRTIGMKAIHHHPSHGDGDLTGIYIIGIGDHSVTQMHPHMIFVVNIHTSIHTFRGAHRPCPYWAVCQVHSGTHPAPKPGHCDGAAPGQAVGGAGGAAGQRGLWGAGWAGRG